MTNVSEQSPAEAIFFAALNLSTAAERAAFLDQACAGDEALRRRVERLLAAYPQVGCFLERPVAEAAELAAPAPRPEDGVPLDFLAPTPRPGALGRLGHYEVLEVVGQGGMGIVLRAFDEKLRRIVAVKVLAPHLATSAVARQRFVREARATAAVTHNHVIDIHAVEDAGPVPYLVMPFIGPTLQQKLDRSGPLPLQEVLRIGQQIASGLAAAHAQGLVHRDVKPANILLENGSQVKITDFGLARAVDDATLTQSGVIAGTPDYVSPEQADSNPVDHRSDLFSLGSVLYTLCAGQPPFRASCAMAVLKRVCDDTPRPLREVNPEVPDWLAAMIARLLAKSPAERYQSAAEVAELLGRHLTHLQQPGMTPADPPLTVTEPRPLSEPRTQRGGATGRSPGRLLRRAACAALLGVGIVAAFWIFSRPGPVKAPDTPNGPDQEAPQARPPLTPEELALRPSPLDTLKRETLELPPDAPPELLAVLGDPGRFALPARTSSHWMAQTGDGRLLAVPFGGNILLFEARTGTLLRSLGGHTSTAYRPAFSPDGKRLASGSQNFIVRVWDVATGREELKLTDHTRSVWSVAYDAEGKRLVSADEGGTVKVWDAQGQPLTSFQGHEKGINQLAFSPDGKRLATASQDGFCKVWDTDTWQEVKSLPAKGTTFDAVAWSRQGKLLAAGDDARVILWNADTYEEHELDTPGKGLLAFTPDEGTLLTARMDCGKGEHHAFTRWDVKTDIPQKSCEHKLTTRGSFAFFSLSPDGRTVFVSSHQPEDPRVRAYDAETGGELFPRRGHRGPVTAVAVSPDGRTLASGGADRTVRLWDLAEWRSGESLPPSRVLEDHTNEVWSVAFSPDGKLLASGGNDGLSCLWDVADGRLVRKMLAERPLTNPGGNRARPSRAPDLSFHPGGKLVATTSSGGPVRLWSATPGSREVRTFTFRSAAQAPWCATFTPEGRYLVAGLGDGTIAVLRVPAMPADGDK